MPACPPLCRTGRHETPTTVFWPRSTGPAHLRLESTPYQDPVRQEGWRGERAGGRAGGGGGEDRKVLGHSQVGLAGQTGCTGVTVTITAENMSECLQGEEEGRIASLHLGRLGS